MLLCQMDDRDEEQENHHREQEVLKTEATRQFRQHREQEVLKTEATRQFRQPTNDNDMEADNQDGALGQGGHRVALTQPAQS